MLWDDRFYLGRLPPYNAAKDPHLRRQFSQPRLKSKTARNSPQMTRTSSRLSRPMPLSDPRKDLELVWEQENIPEFHRVAFRHYLDGLSLTAGVNIAGRELVDLQLKRAQVQVILAAIQQREGLLAMLQERTDRPTDLLLKLQRASVEVVEGVTRWRQTLGALLCFEYAGRNYLLKMKQDIAKDPLLVRSLRRKATALRSRAQDAELVLAQELEPLSPPHKSEVYSHFPPAAQPTDQSDSLSDTFIVTRPFTLELSQLILNDLISSLIIKVTPVICSEVCRSYTRAHLLLYSNKILDDVIANTLKEEIPVCALEAYTEEIDREFIVFQQAILEFVVIEEVKNSTLCWTQEYIAEILTEEFLNQIPLKEIMREAVREEHALNERMITCTFLGLVDSYLSEEWVEIMCEDVLSEELIVQQLDQLPGNILRQVIKENPKKHIERLAEMCYSSLLYQYVSDIWCKKVVEETVAEAQGLSVPSNVFLVQSERRATRRYTRIQIVPN